MLPFTKRPGREESEDQDVITKDDLVSQSASSASSAGTARGTLASVNDDEMTTLMPAKSVTDAVAAALELRSSPRPAAGAPPSMGRGVPSSRPSAPAQTSRAGKFVAQDDDDDGRTVVRGSPKIVRRTSSTALNASNARPSSASSPPSPRSAPKLGGMNTMPTTVSPAAVIKATLESARAGVKRTGDHLMAGPPQDLLEDLADRAPRREPDSGHTAIIAPSTSSVAPPGMVQGVRALSTQTLQPNAAFAPSGSLPPGAGRPMTNPPPPAHSRPPPPSTQSGGYAAQSGGFAAQSGSFNAQYNGPVPSGSVSVPGLSMSQSLPAHFMVPAPPYSDARIDPPGTAITSRTRSAGRPTVSWAMALAAFGLFVGVGAVGVMQGNNTAVAEAGASFVDPSRAAGAHVAAPAALTAPATAVVATAAPVVAPVVPAAAVPAVGIAPFAAAPVASAVAPVAVAPVAVAPVVTAAPAPAPRPVVAAARPAPRPVSRPSAAEAPVAVTKPPRSTKSSSKGSSDSALDEEQRKALKALQESQLETSF